LQALLELTLNGFAYGAVLFLISSGMSITMGLMRFSNLAHGASVMFGGYAVVGLMNAGWPFFLTLPAAFVLSMLGGAAMERGLLRVFYERSEPSQVLVTIGLVFASISVATYLWGAGQQPVTMPAMLTGRVDLGLVDVSAYRLFVAAVGLLIGFALIAAVETSPMGARIRAAVDDRMMAQSCGVNVSRLFTLVFAFSAGVAGLGGALSINLLGLDPAFPLRYLVIILIVVAVGGAGSIRATLASALTLGMIDSFAKYYVAEAGAFTLYVVAAVILYFRPEGLFRRAA
jgi:Branched-chain amino acid ABC-type transport system, permease components